MSARCTTSTATPTSTSGRRRIGLAYRSKIKYDVRGSVHFTQSDSAVLLTGAAPPRFNPVVARSASTINQTLPQQ